MSSTAHQITRAPGTDRAHFVAAAARIIIPAIWLGMIIAIDGLEAPLKFQAPGITIPLGLGIGKLVFTAMNITEAVLAILLLVAVWRTRHLAPAWGLLGGVVGLLIIKTAVVRPLLNIRTEQVISGTGDAGSPWHFVYIGLDGLLFILLAVYTWKQARALINS